MSKEIIVSVPRDEKNLAIAIEFGRYFIQYIKEYVSSSEYNIRADSHRMHVELGIKPPVTPLDDDLSEREVIVIEVSDVIYHHMKNICMVLGFTSIQAAFDEVSQFCISQQT